MDPVVVSPAGTVRGRYAGEIANFRGVPFAAAPEGALRFGAPAPADAWDGVRDCTDFGTASPQLAPAPGAPPAWRPGAGLDCLTLNIWSPELGTVRLPVMVWIHGGLWKYGASSMPQYDGAVLADSGVVVVTVNYRVGFEGFGWLPDASGNRGLRDQLAALEWVRRNIAAFGGDPDNVTVFGQSAGAASAALLATVPAASGLLRRVIAQSIPAGHRDIAEATAVTATIAAAAGVEATRDGFAALPPEAILAVQDAPLGRPEDGQTAFGPVLDGDLVTGPPWASISAGVDLICGFTHDEHRGLVQGLDPAGVDLEIAAGMLGLGPGAAAAYRDAHPGRSDGDVFGAMLSDALVRQPTIWATEAHAHAGGRTWLYDFAWQSPGLGAGHGVDVPFTFGTGTSRFAARFLGTPPPGDFAPLSARIREAWTAFAISGDPGWPRFDLEHRRTRVWDTTPADVTYPVGPLGEYADAGVVPPGRR